MAEDNGTQGLSQVCGCNFLNSMGLVKHGNLEPGNYLAKPAFFDFQIGKKQVMVYNNNFRFGGSTAEPAQKAFIQMHTLRAETLI